MPAGDVSERIEALEKVDVLPDGFFEAVGPGNTGQTDHHQTYPWGELVLVDYRQEGYLFQINYSE